MPRGDRSAPTIAFFGLFGVGNLGNEASLRAALIEAAQLMPRTHIVCVCADPDRVTSEHGIDAVPIRMPASFARLQRCPPLLRRVVRPLAEVSRWIEPYRFARGVDAVIVPGTGILDDFGNRPRDMPYDIFRWSLVCRLARTPFSLVSVGAGPIAHPVSARLMRRAILLANWCTYRDFVSYRFMRSLGVAPESDSVVPDIVFALPCPSSTRPPLAAGHEIVVGVGVMAYYGWDNDEHEGHDIFRTYVRELALLVHGLLERDRRVRLLVGQDSDVVAVEAVLEELRNYRSLPRDSELSFTPATSMEQLLSQIADTDAVIATRFHNVVGALMTGRPAISIGYAEKNAELLERVGLGRYSHDVENFSAEAVLADVDELCERWEQLAPSVWQRTVDDVDRIKNHLRTVFETTPASSRDARAGGGRDASVSDEPPLSA